MARKLRIQYEGAIDHVMSRGDDREPIFRSRPDLQLFLRMLGQQPPLKESLIGIRMRKHGLAGTIRISEEETCVQRR